MLIEGISTLQNVMPALSPVDCGTVKAWKEYETSIIENCLLKGSSQALEEKECSRADSTRYTRLQCRNSEQRRRGCFPARLDAQPYAQKHFLSEG